MATRLRELSEGSRYYIPMEERVLAWRVCQAYPMAKLELSEFSSKAITYDQERVRSYNNYDPTLEEAARREPFARTVGIVETAIAAVCPQIRTWMLGGLCYGKSYRQLAAEAMPYSEDRYYDMRNHVMQEVAQLARALHWGEKDTK